MQPLHSNLDANSLLSTSKFVDLHPPTTSTNFFCCFIYCCFLFVSFHYLVGLLATTKDILEFDVSGEVGTSTSESCSTDDVNTLLLAARPLKSLVGCNLSVIY
jgi:hypothetical protein